MATTSKNPPKKTAPVEKTRAEQKAEIMKNVTKALAKRRAAK